MAVSMGEDVGGALRRIASGMSSLAGITTVTAMIMTSVAVVLVLVIHHQQTQLRQAHGQVSRQAQQIYALRTRPSPVAEISSASAQRRRG